MRYIQSYYTDIGVKRRTNQDSLALLKADTDIGEVLLAVICDGMGGHQFGELASKTIVKKFERWFKTEFPFVLYQQLNFDVIKEHWIRLIEDCNAVLVKYGKDQGIELGSTLTVVLFTDSQYYAAHVGDSRVYVIGSTEAEQITNDHSLVADEVRKGLLTQEEACHDRRANILLECVGITKKVHIDFHTGLLEQGTCFLLCTDGFWRRLTKEEMSHYLFGSQFTDNKMLRRHLNYLVETVKDRGEQDNISAIGVVPQDELGM